jgi:hypothetical protein
MVTIVWTVSSPKRASRTPVSKDAPGPALISKRILLCPVRAPTVAGTRKPAVLLPIDATVNSVVAGALSRSSQPIRPPPTTRAWSHAKTIGLMEDVLIVATTPEGEIGPVGVAMVIATLITLAPAVPVIITHPL